MSQVIWDALSRRPHQSLASVGVAALVQLVTSLGSTLDARTWLDVMDVLCQSAEATAPALEGLAGTLTRQALGQVGWPSTVKEASNAVEAWLRCSCWASEA